MLVTIRTFLIFLTLASCQNTASAPELNWEKPDASYIELEPLEKAIELTSHLYLKATINDSISGVFLFDTGASGLILDQEFCSKSGLNIPVDGDKTYSYGVGESRLLHQYTDQVVIEVDKKKFLHKEIRIMALDSLLSKALDHQIDGIIGLDVFGDFIVDINFDKLEINLIDSISELSTTYQQLAFKKEYRKPMVNLKVTLEDSSEIQCKLVFDMGSGRSISISHQKAKQEQLFRRIKDLDCSVEEVGGIGGQSTSCTGLLRSIHWQNGVRLDSIVVELGKDKNGALGLQKMYDGMVGMEVIRQFNIIIDQKRSLIYLSPRLES